MISPVKAGPAIINAIINGERDPKNLEQYVGKFVKADRQTFLKSLQGTWRSEQMYYSKNATIPIAITKNALQYVIRKLKSN